MFRFPFIFLMCFIVQSLFAQLSATYSSESYRTETHPFRDFLTTTSYSVSDEGNKELYIVQNLKAGTSYQWAVTAICEQNGIISQSDYSDVQTFTTAGSSSKVSNDEFYSTTDITGISVYPNPASDKVTIELNSTLESESNISIIDITGRIIYQTVSNESNLSIDTREFSNGMYQIIVQRGEQIETQKLIITQ